MVPYIVMNIEGVKDSVGLAAAQDRYRALFINTTLWSRYKSDVDATLSFDGYSDCIVTI